MMLKTVKDLLEDLCEPHSELPRLNLGCGWERLDGWVNSDIAAVPGVDAIADITRGLPFENDSVEVVLCQDVLEHVDAIVALQEIHRVLMPGGRLIISAVHFTSRNLYMDPTHLRGFSVRTFDYFVRGRSGTDRSYYFEFAFSDVWSYLQFSAKLGKGRLLVWDRIVEPLMNVHPKAQDLYEMTFMGRLFPAANVLCVLTK